MLSEAKSRNEVAAGNGRVYDPVLGRFLSPDPYIVAPEFTQNFDRYAYVFNNPLIYTDPTGYEPKFNFKRWFYYFLAKIRRYNDDPGDPFNNTYSYELVLQMAAYNSGVGTSGGGGGGPMGGNGASAGTGGNSAGNGGYGVGGNTLPVTDGGDEGPPRVINNSNKIIWFKPEGDYTDPSDGRVYKKDQSYPIIVGHYTTVPIDGILIDGSVFKITNGYEYVIVNEDDTYSTLYLGFKVTIGYWIRGGHLETWPDDTWKSLFKH